MENSHLNTAHMYGRRAENYVRSRRYDEATECHRKAVFHFEEALKIHGSPVVQESLQMQHKYHLKQIDRLRVKKQQYERYLKAMDYQRRKNPQWLTQQNEKMDKYNELQVAIYYNLDDTDGLLETLSKSLTSTGGNDGGTAPKAAGELIGLNHSLHILIQRMAQNIDEYATENEMLREKLRCYEKEKDSGTQGKVEGPASALGKDRDVPKRDIDSTSRDDNLAALAPLEMPVFDLSEFEAH